MIYLQEVLPIIPEDTAVEEHEPRCGCTLCLCRRWLRFTPEEDRYPSGIGLKITSYGGTGGGTKEPDHVLADPVVRESDYRRALALIPDRSLAILAEAWMLTAPPARGPLGALLNPQGPHTRLEAVLGKLNIDSGTLFAGLDEAARQMAVVLGERIEGRPSRMRQIAAMPSAEPEIPSHKRWPLSVDQLARKTSLQRARRRSR